MRPGSSLSRRSLWQRGEWFDVRGVAFDVVGDVPLAMLPPPEPVVEALPLQPSDVDDCRTASSPLPLVPAYAVDDTDADLSDSSGDAADYGFGGGGGEAIFGEGPAVPTVLDADATAEGFESLAAASRDAWSAWAGADVDVWA